MDSTAHDGQHDFDWEFGAWTTRLSLLEAPLTGSAEWLEYTGTTLVTPIWGGRANLVELDVSGPAGQIQGLNLRLYDPRARRWSLNFANARGGAMTPPSIGAFADGRGEFYGFESVDGRPVFVRFTISEIAPTSCRFEQAFSADGGVTWETNWIALDSR